MILTLVILLMASSSAAGYFYLLSQQNKAGDKELKAALTKAEEAFDQIAIREKKMIRDRECQRATWTAIEKENAHLKEARREIEGTVAKLCEQLTEAGLKHQELEHQIEKWQIKAIQLKQLNDQLEHRLSGKPGVLLKTIKHETQ